MRIDTMSASGLPSHDQELGKLPTGVDVEFEGELIFLDVQAAGAELGVRLLRNFSGAEMDACLAVGFECALYFRSGLAMSPNGKDLRLTEWLKGAVGWRDARAPLARLLRHAVLLRSHVQSVDKEFGRTKIRSNTIGTFDDRSALRFRNMLMR